MPRWKVFVAASVQRIQNLTFYNRFSVTNVPSILRCLDGAWAILLRCPCLKYPLWFILEGCQGQIFRFLFISNAGIQCVKIFIKEREKESLRDVRVDRSLVDDRKASQAKIRAICVFEQTRNVAKVRRQTFYLMETSILMELSCLKASWWRYTKNNCLVSWWLRECQRSRSRNNAS